MTKKNNPQLRHWMHTIYAKHVGLEDCSNVEIYKEFQRIWLEFQDLPGLRWLNGQIEHCPSTGRLHIQAYSEWKTSRRRSEVTKLIPSHCEPRAGSRDDARDYCRSIAWRGKDKGQKLVLPDIGQWRKERTSQGVSPKQRAIGMLKLGFTPAEICKHDPDAYFTHWASIQHMYKVILDSGITISTEEE